MSLATELATSTALTPPADAGFSASRAPAAPAPHQQGQEPAPPAEVDERENTIDAENLRKALAEAEAEEAAAAAGGGQQPQRQPAAPQPQPAQQPVAGQEPAQPGPAFAKLRNENRALRERNAYLEGLAQSAQPGGAQQPAPQVQPQQPAQPSPEEAFAQTRARIQVELQTVEQRVMALADKLDNGEITNRQYVEQELLLRRDMTTLYLEDFAAYVKAQIAQALPAPAASLADEILLENQIKTLEARFPWSTVLTDEELHRLARIVEADYAGRGQPLVPGARKTYLVRQGVAELAQVFGPRWHPEIQVQQPQPDAQQPQPPSVAQPQPTRNQPAIPQPTRQDAVRGKMQLAAGHPPATNGAPASGMVGVTEADIDNMTMDEINALPPQTRQRLLYGR